MPKTENSKSVAKDDDYLLLLNSLKLRNSKTIEVTGASNGNWMNSFCAERALAKCDIDKIQNSL